MSKVRVIQIASMRQRAGIENFIMNIVDNINTSKVQIDFIYTWDERGPFDNRLEENGCRFYRLTPYSKNLFVTILHIVQLYIFFIKNRDIDVVHIHGNTAIGCLDTFVAKLAGVNNIVVHSHNSGIGKTSKKVLHNFLKIIINPFIDYRFACSEQAWDWMFLKSKKNLNSNEIINNGIDTKKFLYNEDIANLQREKWGLNDNLVIGFVGRLSEQKNTFFLIEVFHELLEIKPNAKLLIVGDGEYKKSLQKKVKDLCMDDKVIFTGVQSNVNDLMQAMDIFVLPSLWEGFGIVLIEAQAAGLPCVVSDVIAKEVLITNLITQVSLNKSAKKWAKIIIKANGQYEHSNTYEDIVSSGFDVKSTAFWLENFYLDKIN